MALRQAASSFNQGGPAQYLVIHALRLPVAVKAFAVKYTKSHSAFVATASQQLYFTEGPLTPKFTKRWAECQDPLRWSTTAKKGFGKRCVRSWAARRLKIAFTESLKKKGYTRNGSPIEGKERSLMGTAQLLFETEILKTKYTDLLSQTDLTVEEMVRRNQNDKVPNRNQSTSYSKHGKATGRPQGTRDPSPPSVSRSIKLS